MKQFQVIQPSILLVPYIRQYWFLKIDNATPGYQRLTPFGHIVLSFQRKGKSVLLDNQKLPVSYLSGQSTDYTDLSYKNDIDLISIVFQPVGAMIFFKIPMCELINTHIETDALNDSEIKELEMRLSETTDNGNCIKLIENFLLKRIRKFENYNYKRLTTVLNSINHGVTEPDRLAQEACLSYKQFKRIFSENIGINPKNFLRVTRFQKVSKSLQTENTISLNHLAFEHGYTDKSHLIKDFKEFTGYSPGKYLSLCDPYSDYHGLFRSAFLDSPTY